MITTVFSLSVLLAILPLVLAFPALSNSSFSHPQAEDLAPRQLLERPWKLQIEYSGKTFFDGWDFFGQPDPSNGHPPSSCQADHWTYLPVGVNRDSVRITTRQLFSGGVFIIDVRLMPWGCGVWPAFWTLGYNDTWPLAGEIDIIEGIQAVSQNQMTIHTKPGCVVDRTPGRFSGNLLNPICDRASGGTGCSEVSPSPASFGEQVNAQGGGVYAMQWDGDGIKMWSFLRKDIPADITSGFPNPARWGRPVAAWGAATCDPFEYFKPQTLILNINLCGDWAGQLYNQFPYCPGTCAEHISNPANLNNAIWLINSIKVYQLEGETPVPEQAPTNANLTGSPGPVNFVQRPVEAKESGERRGLSEGEGWMGGALGGKVLWLGVVLLGAL